MTVHDEARFAMYLLAQHCQSPLEDLMLDQCRTNAGHWWCWPSAVCRQPKEPSGGGNMVYIIKSHLGRDVY